MLQQIAVAQPLPFDGGERLAGLAHEAADRIVLLRHGVIAENGTPAEVMDESQDPETIEFFSHFRH